MQLGFVIDQTRCIGCHACTVACKSENDVPVGSFRTWVKYTEQGEFPTVRRSFAVLRCNQCSSAPCVTICPVSALEKRDDGIVDIDPKACIGCKACMQGCPYDALYLNDHTGTAEKCHFCAHRTERGLAPACAVVCPTEAIIPGDFHDPESAVSRMRREHELAARKTEAGTGPNVLYRDVSPAGIDPMRTSTGGGYIWSDRPPGQLGFTPPPQDGEGPPARTTYDVPRAPLWGGRISGYLFAKSLACGAFLAGLPFLPPFSDSTQAVAATIPSLALVFLVATMVMLVADLKRPDRFYYIIIRPNWDSWLARGTFILGAYGLLLMAWWILGVLDRPPQGLMAAALSATTALAAVLSAAYTGWLFAQAKGRVLWMKRWLWAHLVVQALVGGTAVLLLAGPLLDFEPAAATVLRLGFLISLLVHGVFVLIEPGSSPRGREREYAAAAAVLESRPFATAHARVGMLLGVLAPLVLTFLPFTGSDLVAAVLALTGLFAIEDAYVRAGQALPIS